MRRLSCDHNLRFISKMDSTYKSPSSFSSYKSQYDGGERRMRETLLHCLAGHSARNWLPAETPTGIAQFANHYKRVSARSLVCAFNFSELSRPGRNGRMSRKDPRRGLSLKAEYAGTHAATLGGPTQERFAQSVTTAEALRKTEKRVQKTQKTSVENAKT